MYTWLEDLRTNADCRRRTDALEAESRHLKIRPNAFGEKLALKLMIRAAERWRAIGGTDFERRQMEAVKAELDRRYETRNGLVAKPSPEANQTQFSSTSQI